MSQVRKEAIKIRLNHDLSEGEKQATEYREVKVLQCLKSLGIACDKNNLPTIAVLGSGGGLRAMLALLGTLVEMKNQGLLDTVMYLCGVSGSTWSMSLLYDDNDWTENVQDLEKKLCDTLSKRSWSWQEAYDFTAQAAEDELFSLTDAWASFCIYRTLEQYDQTKLSQHQEASANGTNPYPIYAAVEANIHKTGANSPGTWFEFTPHESGFPGLGAFVCTKDLGSKFDNGKLNDTREEKNICYLQGLWGSALGSVKDIIKYLKEHVFGRPRGHKENAVLKLGNDCTCGACPCILLLLELHVQASVGKESEGIFRELKEILKGESSKKAYQKCCEMSETWGSKTWEESMRECAELLEMEFGEMHHSAQSLAMRVGERDGDSCYRRPGRRKAINILGRIRYLLELQQVHVHCCGKSLSASAIGHGGAPITSCTNAYEAEFALSELLKKAAGILLKWRNTEYSIEYVFMVDAHVLLSLFRGDPKFTGLAKDKVIHLIDAGLAINSAYPLVLRPERKVKLILSFDFSSGDPFETIKKTAKYCEENHIPFPKIDLENLTDTDNPSDCYIFKGKDVPTVMHFPLFNNKNCPGEIDLFREMFSTFNLSYKKDSINKLLDKAKMNVSNNKKTILKEIQHIVSSSTKEF